MKFSDAETIADALAAPGPLLGRCELDVRCCCDPVRLGTASMVAGRPILSLSVAFGTSNWTAGQRLITFAARDSHGTYIPFRFEAFEITKCCMHTIVCKIALVLAQQSIAGLGILGFFDAVS